MGKIVKSVMIDIAVIYSKLVYMPRKGRIVGIQEPRERADGLHEKTSFFIGEHLERIAREHGFTKDEAVNGYKLAQKIGVAPAQVSRWLRNIRPARYEMIEKIAEKLNVPVSRLIGDICGVVSIPVYEFVTAGAWNGQASEYPIEYISLDKAKLTRFGLPENRVIGITVKGDSMEPEIKEGDIVLVADPAWLKPQNGDVVVAWIDGEGVVKRFKKENKVIRLISRNPKYDDIIISADTTEFHNVVIAKVIELERMYR